jgi:hypothetical protein
MALTIIYDPEKRIAAGFLGEAFDHILDCFPFRAQPLIAPTHLNIKTTSFDSKILVIDLDVAPFISSPTYLSPRATTGRILAELGNLVPSVPRLEMFHCARVTGEVILLPPRLVGRWLIRLSFWTHNIIRQLTTVG